MHSLRDSGPLARTSTLSLECGSGTVLPQGVPHEGWPDGERLNVPNRHRIVTFLCRATALHEALGHGARNLNVQDAGGTHQTTNEATNAEKKLQKMREKNALRIPPPHRARGLSRSREPMVPGQSPWQRLRERNQNTTASQGPPCVPLQRGAPT